MPALPNARARRKRAYNLATGAFAAGSSNRAATAAKAKPNQSGKLCLRTAGRANRGVIEILARNRRDRLLSKRESACGKPHKAQEEAYKDIFSEGPTIASQRCDPPHRQ